MATINERPQTLTKTPLPYSLTHNTDKKRMVLDRKEVDGVDFFLVPDHFGTPKWVEGSYLEVVQ